LKDSHKRNAYGLPNQLACCVLRLGPGFLSRLTYGPIGPVRPVSSSHRSQTATTHRLPRRKNTYRPWQSSPCLAQLPVPRPGSPQGQGGSPEGISGGRQSSPYRWIRPWFDPDDGVRTTYSRTPALGTGASDRCPRATDATRLLLRRRPRRPWFSAGGPSATCCRCWWKPRHVRRARGTPYAGGVEGRAVQRENAQAVTFRIPGGAGR
jgi:hypothetical protein